MHAKFRYYQADAEERIHEELHSQDKCLVKMFCGTGKSLLMRHCRIAQNRRLTVYTFPSLALIKQFYTDYLADAEYVMCISSENDAISTTDPTNIKRFLRKCENQIICITYQSYSTLLDCLGDIKINVCIFDEAHHAVGETYKSLIFDNAVCEKQIFFTATPKNANKGITA